MLSNPNSEDKKKHVWRGFYFATGDVLNTDLIPNSYLIQKNPNPKTNADIPYIFLYTDENGQTKEIEHTYLQKFILTKRLAPKILEAIQDNKRKEHELIDINKLLEQQGEAKFLDDLNELNEQLKTLKKLLN